MAFLSLLHATSIRIRACFVLLILLVLGFATCTEEPLREAATSRDLAAKDAIQSAQSSDLMKRNLRSVGDILSHGLSRLAEQGRRQYLMSNKLLNLLPFLIPIVWLLRRRNSRLSRNSAVEDVSADVSDSIGLSAIATDPGLLKQHSQHARITVPATGTTYESIRIFYRPHPQYDKLPLHPSSVPLLVFIHGLGGSIAQFYPLLTSLVNLAPCLAPDLPGCGQSSFHPKAWDAYTTDALVQLLAEIIEKYRDHGRGQGVVLICHSMGTSLGALLASATSPFANLISQHVVGMVAICPVAEPPDPAKAKTFRRLLAIPGPIFDLWRSWDRRGGVQSPSVYRFTGEEADLDTRRLQVRFNEQSRTPVWRRMALGTLPDYSSGKPVGGIPGEAVWAGIYVPLYLVAGEADHVTPVDNALKIARFLGREDALLEPQVRQAMTSVATHSDFPLSTLLQELNEQKPDGLELPLQADSVDSTGNLAISTPAAPKNSSRIPFKVRILPSPASHALLYSAKTARPLSAHIQHFLANAVDHRLSLGWQLQRLTTEGKWDVRNLEKWKRIPAVSRPIARIFRAMKTLREVDEEHAPKQFVKDWAPTSPQEVDGGSKIKQNTSLGMGKDGLGPIAAIVDISHESPVYNPEGLERGGIAYRKFPTVSKLPPTVDEVKHFLDLTDSLRAEFVSSGPLPDKATVTGTGLSIKVPHAHIAVHCHYGFNRTGFFIVCYLVERLGWRLGDAIKEFAECRPPGIRHAHFVDELWSRYWTRDGGERGS